MPGFRLSTRITVAAITLVAAGAMALMLIENARHRDIYLSGQQTNLEQRLHAEKIRLSQAIGTLRQDVLFLSNTPPVSAIMHAALNRRYGARDGDAREKWEVSLQQIFSAFSAAHPDYHVISYIGVADGGREIVRVNNRAGKVEITPRDRLQTKEDRKYFQAALGLHEGKVHISEFGLHRDWWVIEQPNKPTLHAVTPVLTESGEIFGMVVIDMAVTRMLESATRNLPQGVQTYITNMDGEYLLHPDAQRSFGFELGGKDSLAADFPFLKTIFDPRASEHFPLQAIAAKEGAGYLAAERIHFDSGNPARFLLLAYHLPGVVAAQQIATIPAKHIVGGFMAMLLVSGIALFALRRTFAPLEQLTAAAEKIAAGNHDVLLPQNSSGEIGSLANAFSVMLSKLSQREHDIRWVNAWLEDRVKERTVELEQARREAEAALRLHKAVSDTAMDGFWVADAAGNLLEANEAYAKISGYPVGELVKMHISQLEAKEQSPEEIRAHIAKTIAQGYDRFETRHRHKDGHEIDIEVSATYMAESQRFSVFCRDITRRKQAKEALRIAAAAFETQDAIMITDAEGNIIRVNHAFSGITGYSLEEVVGRNMGMMDSVQDSQGSCIEMLQQAIRDGSWAGEIYGKRKNGQIYPKWMTVTAVKNERQEITHYVSIFSDITTRKHVGEERLRESEERFRGTLEQVAVGIAHAALDGSFKQVNQKFCEIVGYTRDELLHMSFHDITFPDDLDKNIHYIRQLLAGEMPTFSMEKRYVRKDRSLVWVNLTVSMLRDVGGTPQYTIGVIEDITERKLADALAERFGSLLQSSFNEIYLFDADSLNFLLTSEGAEKNLGYSDDELNQLTPLDIEPSFTRESFDLLVAPLWSGKQQSLFFETIHRRKDGTTYPVEVRMQLMQEEYPVFLSIVQDITARKQAELDLLESHKQLRGLSAHLQAVREEERVIIAREVHDELGQILTALRMKIAMLRMQHGANDPMLAEQVPGMVQLVDRAIQGVRDVAASLRPSALDMGIVPALEWLSNDFAAHSGIPCTLHGAGVEIELDELRAVAVFRIVQEALTNVARHAAAGQVEIELKQTNAGIEVMVRDNGQGFYPSALAHKKTFGLLGMRERALALGGEVEISSTPGHGTEVFILLPRNKQVR